MVEVSQDLLALTTIGMEEAHRTGSPLARPLWWHWPADALAHDASRQWLLGEAVLVSPVLEKGADQVGMLKNIRNVIGTVGSTWSNERCVDITSTAARHWQRTSPRLAMRGRHAKGLE